jgi:RND family efflux transporter MFP subunit
MLITLVQKMEMLKESWRYFMKKRQPLFVLLLIALAFSPVGCTAKKSEEAAPELQNSANPSVITLSEEAMKIAKIQKEKAALTKVPAKISAAGDMVFNQKRLMNLTSRVAGRVENVSAYVGDRVKEGDLLLSLYSPDFLTSQAEFLQAAERLRRLSKDDLQDDIGAAKALLDSAKRKLMLLGMKEADFKELEETRQIKPLLPISAPFSGTIIEGPIVLGDQVAEGTCLFKVADLSVLWAHVHIYEKDLALIKPGMSALVRVQAYPDQVFQGTLTLLNDVVDEKTRTVIGRVEVQNAHGLLKPGMYVEVELVLPSGAVALLVPESSVQELEGKKVVFIPAGERSFRFQEVRVGQKFHDSVEITQGLSPGDSYVRDGFLLKSEYLKKDLAVE